MNKTTCTDVICLDPERSLRIFHAATPAVRPGAVADVRHAFSGLFVVPCGLRERRTLRRFSNSLGAKKNQGRISNKKRNLVRAALEFTCTCFFFSQITLQVFQIIDKRGQEYFAKTVVPKLMFVAWGGKDTSGFRRVLQAFQYILDQDPAFPEHNSGMNFDI